MTTFNLGDRVRVIREIDLYPVGVFPVGLTGTVVTACEKSDVPEIAWVRLDATYDVLAEWDNCLVVYPIEETADGVGECLSDVTPNAFENIV